MKVGKVLLILIFLVGCAPDRLPDREPDLYLEDGTPCWYYNFSQKFRCERVLEEREHE